MKLAAIDIGTNSVHMIIVEVLGPRSFRILEREKEMVKLGAGVFATNRLSDRAFAAGLETIDRYVKLAEQMGVDDIITAATSAIREAQNGEAFMQALAREAGLTPRIISGPEEARLIFLAVKNSIALADDTVLVLDIGGGSTEVVVGDRQSVQLRRSLRLGVQRLLDMFPDHGEVGAEARQVLAAHIRFVAQDALEQVKALGYHRVIGTSGTIRTLGEAAHLAGGGDELQSVNAEVISRAAIAALTADLLQQDERDRAAVKAISAKRADTIHLGGVLLVQLLEQVGATEITLCDASLREGLILDYLERHSTLTAALPATVNLRYRKVAQLVQKYQSDWSRNQHVAGLALQLFDQTAALHDYGDAEREILEFGALLHDTGQFISYRKHHKNSRYIVKRTDPRGFTDEEVLLIGHLARYHCKAPPTKKHKKFRRLSKPQRQLLQVLAGILRIAVNLDKTKNQHVHYVRCDIADETITIGIAGQESLDLEIWAAQQNCEVLAAALERDVVVERSRSPVSAAVG